MILASSLLCNSRSSGVSSVGGQEESRNAFFKNLTLTVMGNDDRDFGPVYIDSGLDRGSQFAVWGRKEMMGRLDDGELGTWVLEGLALSNAFTRMATHFRQ